MCYSDYSVLKDLNLNVISKRYDSIMEFSIINSDITIVAKDNKYGIINKNGDELIEPIYDKILNTKYNYLTLKLGNKFTIIDTFQYLMLPGSNYKNDNLREVMTSRNGIYPFLLSEFMNCREFWINNSYYRRMDYIEYPDHYSPIIEGNIKGIFNNRGTLNYYDGIV